MKDLSLPTALLLAGGVGKRFAPLKINKSLLPIFGKPVLAHSLEQLERVGFAKVLIVTNQENDNWLNSYQSNLKIEKVIQEKPVGMAGALLEAKKLLSGPTLVINPNDFVNDSLFTDLLTSIEQNPNQTRLVAKQMDRYFNGGYLKTEGENLLGIVEKPGSGNEPSKLVKLVFDYFSKIENFLNLLEKTQSKHDDVYEVALSELMTKEKVGFLPYFGYWQALKRPDMILDLIKVLLNERLLPNISASAYVHPAASIEGDVVVEAGARIMAGASLIGPVYVGKNTLIGQNALVRESVVEENSIVGFGSEVARSYVGPNCKLHHNFVGDSILESNINPSFGTVFANWRIDNKPITVAYPSGALQIESEKFGGIVADGAFLGVNCSVMPGTVIGQKARVFPNCRIKGLIADNTCTKNNTF